MKYITHLTISTGHSRKSYRNEVDDKALSLLYNLLADAAATGEPVDLPLPGYRIKAEGFGQRRAVVVTVYGKANQPLVTLGVARQRAKALWEMLIETQHVTLPSLDCGDEPPEPWAATILWPALNNDLDAALWLGDFERIAAWAWIEG